MADQKLTNKERLREITDGIEQGIKELFENDKYSQYLATMSRFHRYSLNNTMLIYMQKPDAALVAGFNKWKEQFGRYVKKGERGITIIAPTPFKTRIEEQKIDPDTKAPLLDQNGQIVIEEKEIEIPLFRPVKVFDVSQTDGKPLPQLASKLSGDVQQYEAFMEALCRSSAVPIMTEPISGDMDGFFSPAEQRIVIRDDMSQVQTVSATVHEIAHSKLHNYEIEKQVSVAGDESKEIKPKDRRTEEVEAESISYAVCQYYGIQTGENSFGYIAAWSKGKELSELKASLELINKTASGLITDIDKHFSEICKERGIDLTASEQGERVQQTAEILQEEKRVVKSHNSTMVPESPEQALDEYPLPDKLKPEELEKCGYVEDDLLPLSKERAMELIEQDLTIYCITHDGRAEMVFDREDMEAQSSAFLFAAVREEWEEHPDFDKAIQERLNHQNEREDSFINYKGDCFAIYQVKHEDAQKELRYTDYEYLKTKGLPVNHENYDLVYTAPLVSQTSGDIVEQLYETFNVAHPADYHHPSMSVSDIIAVKQDGVLSCYYVDSFVFQQLPDFIPVDNYLKNAEVAMEDDYGMIDGIINNGKSTVVAELERQAQSGQPISLIDLVRATHCEEPEKKKSVMVQLKSQAKPEIKKTAQKKSAEREL